MDEQTRMVARRLNNLSTTELTAVWDEALRQYENRDSAESSPVDFLHNALDMLDDPSWIVTPTPTHRIGQLVSNL